MDETYNLDRTALRVLGVLIEKQTLTPDVYPMSQNSIVAACNQLTSREPVMSLSPDEVGGAIRRLIGMKLVAERQPAGSRSTKYEHRLTWEWRLEGAPLAALCLLMLRGAQTSAEVRSRSGRLYNFDSNESVDAAMDVLAERYPPMAQRVARGRWMHCLCGEAEAAADCDCSHIDVGLAGRVAALEAEVAALKTRLSTLIELAKD